MLKNIKLKKFKDNEKIIIMVLVLCQKCLTFLHLKNKKINFLIDKNKKGEYNTRQFKYKNSEEGK